MTKQTKLTERKLTLADAVSEAFSEAASLGEEMRSWADNLEEKFSATDKYSRVSEAADALENLSEPSVPEALSDREVTHTTRTLTPRQMSRRSRGDRRDDALVLIELVKEHLDELMQDDSQSSELRDEAEGLRDELDNATGELESVEFPGMYG